MDEVKAHTDVLKLFEDKEMVKICAPMVRYSKIQFRNLVRNYNCDLCYTPMILADSFCQSVKARRNEFTTSLCDTPLITQFASNSVNDFVCAANIVAPYCDGVDLNCGCPQRWAKHMGIGCIMLEKPELISDMVNQCRNQILKPFTISVKMRILKDIKTTIEICRRLDKCGATYLTVHGRTPCQQTGEVNFSNIKLINENVNCPVVANGSIKTLEDCYNVQEVTKCKGIMVANSILTNPMVFSGSVKTYMDCVQNWVDICFNSTLSDNDYEIIPINNITINDKPPHLTFQCFHHHLVFMLEKVLPRSRRRIFNSLQSFKDVLQFLYDEFGIKPQLFDLKIFEKNRVLPLWSDNSIEQENFINYYDDETNSGSYFASKVDVSNQNEEDYNLEDIFLEV